MAFDPLKLESGLLGNVDVTIRDAAFVNRLDSFDNGQTLELHLTMLVEGDDGGEQVQYFRCGEGWETNDSGVTAVREDGKERNFHANSKVGELFKGLVTVMADDQACDKEIRSRVKEFPAGPREAGFWKGLRVHLDRAERKGGGDIKDYEVLVIDGFNGVEGAGKPANTAKKASGTAKKTSGAKKAAAKKDEAEGGLTDALVTKLDAIADDSSDHDEFMEQAFAQVEEATSDEAVKAAVSDDSEEGDGIWARALARYAEAQG